MAKNNGVVTTDLAPTALVTVSRSVESPCWCGPPHDSDGPLPTGIGVDGMTRRSSQVNVSACPFGSTAEARRGTVAFWSNVRAQPCGGEMMRALGPVVPKTVIGLNADFVFTPLVASMRMVRGPVVLPNWTIASHTPAVPDRSTTTSLRTLLD